MLNKVILIGHVGQDPEIKSTEGGKPLAIFSLATSQTWKDKTSGERKQSTEWHRVVCFQENLVDVIKKYVKKGSKIYLEGSLKTRKWDDKGVDRYSTEINIKAFDKLVLLDKKEGAATPPDSAYDDGEE